MAAIDVQAEEVLVVTEDNEVTLIHNEIRNIFQDISSRVELGTE